MFNVGGPEVLVILFLALVVLGPQRLPEAARQIGKFMGELRRMSSGFQDELKSAFDDPLEMKARAKGAAVVRPAQETSPALAPVAPAEPVPASAAPVAPLAPTPAKAPAAKKAVAKKQAATKAAPRKRAAPLRAADRKS